MIIEKEITLTALDCDAHDLPDGTKVDATFTVHGYDGIESPNWDISTVVSINGEEWHLDDEIYYDDIQEELGEILYRDYHN